MKNKNEQKDKKTTKKTKPTLTERLKFFSKAEDYLKKINEKIDSNPEEYSEEIEDLPKAEGIADAIGTLYGFSKEKRALDKLKEFIKDNNEDYFTDVAIIAFLDTLYGGHGDCFNDFFRSFKDALDCIHKESTNKELIALVDDFFSDFYHSH